MIRCMDLLPFFASRQAHFIQAWMGANYTTRSLQIWSQVMVAILVFILSTGTATYIVATRAERAVEISALAITYAVVLPYFLSIVSESYVNTRTDFAALERLLQYMELPQEPPHVQPHDPPHDTWPKGGTIVFRDVSMCYRPGLPLALRDFSATVDGGSKCGIVGRTGAGKSTLILVLFRLVEPKNGQIAIDGVDTLSMGLRALRRAITIIPQDPVLHEGSVAHNLDPFGKTSEATLRDVLRRARLEEAMLERSVSKGGSNLSSGERQLLCFARSLLEDAKILILDEATSNLDEGSDAAIQKLLRDEFARHTVLTIAHRLVTVIDYDKLLVMGAGRLLEAGSPSQLLGDERSVLASMARALGEAGEASLKSKAAKS